DVENTLAGSVQRAADVGGDGVVSALDLGGHADVVIGHAQAENSNAEEVQHAAQAGVGHGVGVPMRQEHESVPPSGGKPPRIDQIVFWIRRAHRRSKTKKAGVGATHFFFQRGIGYLARAEDLYLAPLQAEIDRPGVGVELVAGSHDALVVFAEKLLAIFWPAGEAVAAGPIARPFHAPL